jgi:hypothetical protein
MREHRSRSWSRLLLILTVASWTATTSATERTPFVHEYGGYLVSTDFTVDGKDHTVISPPVSARPGDLLSIRPLRLNNDEYFILQKCKSPHCSEAQVVRAWNALGHMGPDLVGFNKIPIEAGSIYMLWMQRISTFGGNTFSAYNSNSPALVFIPAGSAQVSVASDLAGARELGPTRIARSSPQGNAFVAKFEGGSVVRMRLLRAPNNDRTEAPH